MLDQDIYRWYKCEYVETAREVIDEILSEVFAEENVGEAN